MENVKSQIRNWYDGINSTVHFFAGISIIVLISFFRKDFVKFVFLVLRKWIFPSQLTHIIQIEWNRHLASSLSWLCFALFVWLGLYLLNLSHTVLVYYVIGIPLLLTIFKSFDFGISLLTKVKEWRNIPQAIGLTSEDDELNRVEILAELIHLVKYLVTIVVFCLYYLTRSELEVTTIIIAFIIAIQCMIVLSSITWMKNIVGGLVVLAEGTLDVGTMVHILGQKGIVEAIYLRYVLLRRKDLSLVHIPNGAMLNTIVQVMEDPIYTEWKSTIRVVLDAKSTTGRKLRAFVNVVDDFLSNERQYVNPVFHEDDSEDGSGGAVQNLRKILTSARHRKEAQRRLSSPSHHNAERTLYRHAYGQEDVQKLDTSGVQYWVTVQGLYTVQIDYFSKYTNARQYDRERSNIMLAILQMMEDLELNVESKMENLSESTAPLTTEDED